MRRAAGRVPQHAPYPALRAATCCVLRAVCSTLLRTCRAACRLPRAASTSDACRVTSDACHMTRDATCRLILPRAVCCVLPRATCHRVPCSAFRVPSAACHRMPHAAACKVPRTAAADVLWAVRGVGAVMAAVVAMVAVMVAAANYSNRAAIQKGGEVKTHMLGSIMKSAGGCGHGSGGKRQRVCSVLSARRPPACRDEREPNVHRDESGSTTRTLSGGADAMAGCAALAACRRLWARQWAQAVRRSCSVQAAAGTAVGASASGSAAYPLRRPTRRLQRWRGTRGRQEAAEAVTAPAAVATWLAAVLAASAVRTAAVAE